ncbi:hemerythrin family protein [Magnetospirillum sp. 15-1]|uniref:bacteriohemerythrin n=1 Tax=Magnetospirillum sp. 15-1 TaxID=1979370 RepID=UPI000BBBEE5A|nr:hemerythrin family protein [Magnetospirillum sp. 15-1]
MLIWRDAMAVGHPEIDHARKHVIGRINDFERALSTHGPHTALGLFLTGLYEETSTAFGREEKIQRECSFPFTEMHHREHAALLEKVELLKEQYDEMDARGNCTPLLRELAELAKEWITVHIVQSDLKIRPYWLNHNGIYLRGQHG